MYFNCSLIIFTNGDTFPLKLDFGDGDIRELSLSTSYNTIDKMYNLTGSYNVHLTNHKNGLVQSLNIIGKNLLNRIMKKMSYLIHFSFKLSKLTYTHKLE